MKKLYVATVTYTTVVYAEDQDEAEMLVQDHSKDDIENSTALMDLNVEIYLASSLQKTKKLVPMLESTHWLDSIPWGARRTVRQIIAKEIDK